MLVEINYVATWGATFGSSTVKSVVINTNAIVSARQLEREFLETNGSRCRKTLIEIKMQDGNAFSLEMLYPQKELNT